MNIYPVGHLPKTIGKAFAKVQISEESFRAADALLTRIEFETRTNVVEKALKAAAAPVVNEAKKRAPDSVKSGTRQHWSKKVRQQRANTAQHKTTIGASSVRNYRMGLMAIYAGPLYPQGNLINVIGHPHHKVLWGRTTGRVVPPTDYLKQAGESTVAQQNAAFVNKIKTETERIVATK